MFLRACYAAAVFGIAAKLPEVANGPSCTVAAWLAALCLVLGLGTRWVGLMLGAGVVMALLNSGVDQQLLLVGHLGGCAVMALIGGGAFSVDARRHGRRVIRLQGNAPDRGAKD